MSIYTFIISILTFVLLSALLALSKDKPQPVLTDSQKVELLTLERDLLQAQVQAAPIESTLQQAVSRLQAKKAEIEKTCGDGWKIDLRNFECLPPEKAPEKTPEKPVTEKK